MTAATPSAGGRRRALALLRRGYLVLLVAVVGWVAVTRSEELARLLRGASPPALLAVLVASLGQLALTSAVWHSGLRSLGVAVPGREVLVATAVSGPARYLPGGIWYAAGRAAVLREHGVPGRALVAVAALEMLLAPVVGLTIGLGLLGLTGGAGGRPLPVWLAGVAVLLLALAAPPVVNRALRWRTRDAPAPRLSWPALGRLVAWLAAFWLWSGGVFALYVSAFPALPDAGPVTVTGGYAVAWAAGWLAVFAPQGVGVFEATLAGLLGGGGGLALVLGGYRAIVLLRDLGAAAVATALTRRR